MQEEFPADDLSRPVPQPWLFWMIRLLGINSILLPLAALIAFVVVLILILRGKGPAMVGAILLVVPWPLFLGLLGAIRGVASTSSVIALGDAPVPQSLLFQFIAEIFLHILVGLTLTFPVFLLATIGLVVRALQGERSHAADANQPIAANLAN